MGERLNYGKAAPGATRAMNALETYLDTASIEKPLAELIRLRASQLNGCAYCIDMHTKDARVGGETEQRLYTLSVWRETPFYTDRERAALEWTEALTLVADGHVPDAVYEAVRPHFTDKELADLTLTVITINGWNRFAIAFRDEPGTYQPKVAAQAATN